MKNAWAANALQTVPPAPANPSVGYPTGGDPATALPPTEPGAYWFHMVTCEILNVIGAAGITPSSAALDQLLQALLQLFSPKGSGVTKVFGRAGEVSAQSGDYSIDQITNAVTGVFGRRGPVAAQAGDYNIGQITGAVTSVFGRAGPVGAAAGDYDVSQVTGALAAASFQGANQSLGANGFQRVPGGLVMQWGSLMVGANGAATFTYPMTFPHASFPPLVSMVNTPYLSVTGAIETVPAVVGYTAAGAVIENKTVGVTSNPGLAIPVAVLVFGY